MQAVVQLNAPPNTPVFTLQARDPDTDHNIHYFIVRDRTGGRFEVDERSGVVRTRGTDLFQLDMEYVLYVKAEDQNGKVDDRRFQSTPEERLSIVGGKRAPQFYMPSYEAEIPENQKKDSEWVGLYTVLREKYQETNLQLIIYNTKENAPQIKEKLNHIHPFFLLKYYFCSFNCKFASKELRFLKRDNSIFIILTALSQSKQNHLPTVKFVTH